MSSPLVWNVDPVAAQVGSLQIRYYGICFGLAIVSGFIIWFVRVRRHGESVAFAEQLLYWGLPAVIIGGRLGHYLFYRPETLRADPLRVLAVWEGGVASHGVAVGLALALWIISVRNQVPWTRLSDYLAPAVALSVGWVRVGNFFNSELVGRPATVPWAVVFARHDAVPRHPSQLYDLLIGPATYLVLRTLERRNIRPVGSGLVAGTFLLVYFGLRIFVEQYKDFYVEQWRETLPVQNLEHSLGFPIHTGQWLSVLPVLAGVLLIARAMRRSTSAGQGTEARPLPQGRPRPSHITSARDASSRATPPTPMAATEDS